MKYTNFETLGHLPEFRWSAKLSDRSAIMQKDQYIELINQLLEKCTDIDTLDLVYKILARTC